MRRARGPALLVALLVLVACGTVGRTGRAAGGYGPPPSPPHGTAARNQDGGTPTPGPTSTAPLSLSFAVIGDFGFGDAPEFSVLARLCQWNQEHPLDLVITAGDNVYPAGEPDRIDAAVTVPFACVRDAGIPIHAVLGNHDIMTDGGAAELADPQFGFGGGANYVLRLGGVRFVMADSNAMDRAWLAANLPAEPGDRWTIVVFHHPVFSPGLHGDTPGFEDLPALFEKNGVDLVLNGHDHLYAASNPVNGIVYVVSGGGGASTYPCHEEAVIRICRSEFEFLSVDAGPDAITVTAVPTNGPPLDQFQTTGTDPQG